jgi:hypothetical protein
MKYSDFFNSLFIRYYKKNPYIYKKLFYNKNSMKKYLNFIIIVSLILLLSSCGSKEQKSLGDEFEKLIVEKENAGKIISPHPTPSE